MNDRAGELLSASVCRGILRAQLPHWALCHHGQDPRLQRDFATRSWSMTVHAANAVAFLAEVGWHHPVMTLSYKSLRIELCSHDVEGITMRDIELARRIEEVLTWLPGPDDALPGHARRRVT